MKYHSLTIWHFNGEHTARPGDEAHSTLSFGGDTLGLYQYLMFGYTTLLSFRCRFGNAEKNIDHGELS